MKQKEKEIVISEIQAILSKDPDKSIAKYLTELVWPDIIHKDFEISLQIFKIIDDFIVIDICQTYILEKLGNRPIKHIIDFALNKYPTLSRENLPFLKAIQIDTKVIDIDKYMINDKFEYPIEIDKPIRVSTRHEEAHYYIHGGQMHYDMKYLTKNCEVRLFQTDISKKFKFKCQFASPIAVPTEPDAAYAWRYYDYLVSGQGFTFCWIPK